MNAFPSYEEISNMLEEIADEIPSDFFVDLHGGIVLIEQSKFHAESKENHPLYIMGEYERSRLGSQIKIYYGSFEKIYGSASDKLIREQLKKTLVHEFTHHLEHKAGLKGLEVKDAESLYNYRENTK